MSKKKACAEENQVREKPVQKVQNADFLQLDCIEIPFDESMVDDVFRGGVLKSMREEYKALSSAFRGKLPQNVKGSVYFKSGEKSFVFDVQNRVIVPNPADWESHVRELHKPSAKGSWKLAESEWLKSFLVSRLDGLQQYVKDRSARTLRENVKFIVQLGNANNRRRLTSGFKAREVGDLDPSESYYIPTCSHPADTLASFLIDGYVPADKDLIAACAKWSKLCSEHPDWFDKKADCLDEEAVMKAFRANVAIGGHRRDEIIKRIHAQKYKPEGVDGKAFEKQLLQVDEMKFAGDVYPENWLTDLNRGHWDLWPDEEPLPPGVPGISVSITRPVIARNPLRDIRENGLVAIDFGTKSTSVAFLDGGSAITPFPIGRAREGGASGADGLDVFENPTVIHFVDFDSFLKSYRARTGRPQTKWADVLVSHDARELMLDGTDAAQMSTFASELKQWTCSGRKLYVRNKVANGKSVANLFEFPAYENFSNDAVDPVEIYAYYIGCYLNNMYNGVFLKYVLSYSVTFDALTKAHILQSFERGLRKSLPRTVLNDEKAIGLFQVRYGNSEPGAYAVCALKELGILPTDTQKSVFYGVFDFGGGTTDFDFGVCSLPQDDDDDDFDYVVEKFSPVGYGDRYLGGENLLRLLAYTVCVQNRDELFKHRVSFAPPFEPSERLANAGKYMSESVEAETNMRLLTEKFRPLWESPDAPKTLDAFKQGSMNVMLFGDDGEQVSVKLVFDSDSLSALIRERITSGVNNFFVALKSLYRSGVHKKLTDVKEVHVLLAGNSCRSKYVTEAFAAAVKSFESNKDMVGCIKLHAPLGCRYDEKDAGGTSVGRGRPNCKTGVVWGLLMGREGGSFLFKGNGPDARQGDGTFNFYVGRNRRGEFKPTLSPQSDTGWKRFRRADAETVEFWYSTDARVLTQVAPATRFVSARLRKIISEASIVIRIKSIYSIEYAVAKSCEEAEQGKFVEEPVELELPR